MCTMYLWICTVYCKPVWIIGSTRSVWTEGVILILRNAQTAKPNTILVLHIQFNGMY